MLVLGLICLLATGGIVSAADSASGAFSMEELIR